MVTNKKFAKYAKHNDVETQSLYIEDEARFHLVDELRSRGTRRILVICDNSLRRLHPFEEVINSFEEAGFRVFVYCQPGSILLDRDIEGGFKMYGEYNCDTIVAIGGTSEIDCGKLVAALVTNPVKTVAQFVGIDKISNEIPLLCTIMTENCASSTTGSAEFFDNTSKQWKTVISSVLVPHMVVIDTEISERVSLENSISSALTALCVTIEAYISPVAKEYPEYRASAINASMIFFKNLEKFCNNPSDNFLRKQIAVAGFYAGLASRKTGIGYAHIIMHTILGRYKVLQGSGLIRILILVLREQLVNKETCSVLSELAKAAHFCSQGLSDDKAAESLVDNLERLYLKVSGDAGNPIVDAADIDMLVSEVENEARTYVLSKDIDSKALRKIILALS